MVNRREWDRLGMWHIWGRREICTWFWCGNLKEIHKLARLRRRWANSSERDLQEIGWEDVD